MIAWHWNAIEAKYAWMRGEIDDNQLDAAGDAAGEEQNDVLEKMLIEGRP